MNPEFFRVAVFGEFQSSSLDPSQRSQDETSHKPRRQPVLLRGGRNLFQIVRLTVPPDFLDFWGCGK
jgi:hypothetical protein